MKVLLVTSNWTETLGHVVRGIAIAEQLLKQGHQAAFLCPKSYRELLPQQAAWYESAPKPSFTNKNYFGLHTYEDILFASGHTEPQQIRCTVEREREVIREYVPDIILNDEQFTIGISASLEHVPVASIVTWPLHPNFRSPQEPDIPLRDMMLRRLRSSWNQVLAQYELQPVAHLSELLFHRSSLLIAPTSPSLEPELAHQETRVHYVGPLAPQGKFAEVPPWMDALHHPSSERATVFIYLSSLPFGMNTIDSFELLADSYRGTNIQAVFGIGKFNEATEQQLRRLEGPNLRFERFVPGEAMMARAQLAIFPGTHSMMVSAAKYGVPCLLFPDFFERAYNASCLERVGLGFICEADGLTSERIRELSQQLISSRGEHTRALQVQVELNALGGASKAVAHLDTFVQEQHVSSHFG
ncbi:glycosyltransferase [Paenibacillus taiwanensis]|uniref:glycosyltransferase n=1 Tax=Paenibacillus taiwanensis TaxID=401638 RepID=UPI00040C64A0|nr:nucleotide disphospho-sugar-binding domain-containing protein [Paenibacillus taiwanensis]